MKEQKKSATELFSEWADKGKDVGMAIAHEPAVNEMLEFIFQKYKNSFTFLDAGCGNGWVVRKVKNMPQCKRATGLDGAVSMINNAKKFDPTGEYFCANLLDWTPDVKFDIVYSMEVFYYSSDPEQIVRFIIKNWIKPGGSLVIGLDYYYENPKCHSWAKDLNLEMSLLHEHDWLEIFKKVGFKNTATWKANVHDDHPGTLVVYGNT